MLDGELQADGLIRVQALGGGFQHGEGLFETLPVRSGQPGFFERHCQRLAASARLLELDPAPDLKTWRADLDRLLGAWPPGDLAVRLFLFRDGEAVRRLVAGTRLEPGTPSAARLGLVADLFSGPRPLAQHKTMNYLVPRLAHKEGTRRGFDEVLFRRSDGVLLEGTRSSLFVVKAGQVRTPTEDLPILPGVTREVLLEVGLAAGIPITQGRLQLEDLLAAEEVFLTASLRGLRPVSQVLDGPQLAAPGPLTRRLQSLYLQALDGCARS